MDTVLALLFIAALIAGPLGVLAVRDRRRESAEAVLADVAVPLDGDVTLDRLRRRAALLVHLDGPERVRPLALRDLDRVADLDAGDERLAVDVLDEALDVGGEPVGLGGDLARR